MPTLFERILAREIPAAIVYEDAFVFAFKDIQPAAPQHVLVVPRKPIPNLESTEPGDVEILGHLLLAARKVAGDLGLDTSGYRLVLNNGADAGQVVPHLHLHVVGGRALGWPPG